MSSVNQYPRNNDKSKKLCQCLRNLSPNTIGLDTDPYSLPFASWSGNQRYHVQMTSMATLLGPAAHLDCNFSILKELSIESLERKRLYWKGVKRRGQIATLRKGGSRNMEDLQASVLSCFYWMSRALPYTSTFHNSFHYLDCLWIKLSPLVPHFP